MVRLVQPNSLGWNIISISLSLIILATLLTACAMPVTTVPRLTHTIPLSEEVVAIALSPDNTLLATGFATGTLQLWDISSQSLVKSLEGHSNTISEIAFSSDGQLLVSGSLDRTTKIWQVSDGKLQHTLEGAEDVVSSVAFSPDGKFIVTGSWDTKTRVWQVSDGKLSTTLDHFPNQVNDVAYSPDGKTLATTAGKSLYLWQLPQTDQPLGKADSTTGVMDKVSFSPDGSQIITIGPDKTISRWQAQDGSLINTTTSIWPAYQADLNPQNTVLAANVGWSIQFWRVSNNEALRPLATSGNKAAVFSADRKTLVTFVAKDKLIQVWEMPQFFVNE